MMDWETCPAVERHADKLRGVWVFRGTRAPVAALFENLKDGASVEQFLEWIPGVDRPAVTAILPCPPVLSCAARGRIGGHTCQPSD